MALETLEKFPEIEGYFNVLHEPEGDVPQVVNELWVGLFLPVRYRPPAEAPDPSVATTILKEQPHYIENSMRIYLADCLDRFKQAGLKGAAAWWDNLYPFIGDRQIIFDVKCGRYIPKEQMERFYPGEL